MTDLTEIFGPVISTYTRAQAIEDGEQIEATFCKGAEVYNPVGPVRQGVYVTRALWAEITRGDGVSPGDTQAGRLWDVCWMTSKGRADGPSARVGRVKVGRRVLTVRAECGPMDIDDPSPAITLGFPEDF